MNYYRELLKLRSTYNKLLSDHKHPIDLNTDEQYRLEGYDQALERVVKDITHIIEVDKEADKLAYTE
jgi:hypothetical protein